METFTDLESIKERIEELQNEIADKTATIEGLENVGSELCVKDSEDESHNCPPDCTCCAEDAAQEIESERDELESEQDLLEAFVSETENYFEPLVDHVLSENNGNFKKTLDWLQSNDTSIYSDWDEYVDQYIDGLDCDEFLKPYIDKEQIAQDLSVSETFLEIGGCLIILW
jgi:hypothetical protein